jgi:hypothetical protein
MTSARRGAELRGHPVCMHTSRRMRSVSVRASKAPARFIDIVRIGLPRTGIESILCRQRYRRVNPNRASHEETRAHANGISIAGSNAFKERRGLRISIAAANDQRSLPICCAGSSIAERRWASSDSHRVTRVSLSRDCSRDARLIG